MTVDAETQKRIIELYEADTQAAEAHRRRMEDAQRKHHANASAHHLTVQDIIRDQTKVYERMAVALERKRFFGLF